jgi:F-type H+-transporting ATPase subunit alpha
VGGKTQLPAYQAVAGDLRLSYAQFQEVEVFARFGTQLDEQTQQTLDRGRRIREVLKQRQSQPLAAAEQIAILFAVTNGLFDSVPIEQLKEVEHHIAQTVTQQLPEVCDRIYSGGPLTQGDRDTLMHTLSNP